MTTISSIRKNILEDRYLRYSMEMNDVLSKAGWLELESQQSFDDLSYSLLALQLSGSRGYEPVESDGPKKFRLTPRPFLHTSSPSIFQFFFDLFDLGNTDDAYNEVLVSYLHLEDSGRQEYIPYDVSTLFDVQFFLEQILEQPALVFTGRFQAKGSGDKLFINTAQESQRTFHAICVDIDPTHAPGVTDDLPLSSEVVSRILAKVDPRLVPSYICLTGRGAHLWYIFDKPMQTFRMNNPRRTKYRAMANALYSYIESLVRDLPAELDRHCTSLNHGFRAPGSLTKRGDTVRCYCRSDKAYERCSISALSLSQTLAEIPGLAYDKALVLTERDVEWKSYEDLAREIAEYEESKERKLATEMQESFLQDLIAQGYLDPEDVSFENLSVKSASDLIKQGLTSRSEAFSKATGSSTIYRDIPRKPTWHNPPHQLIAGKTGGVYKKIYDNITRVRMGKRYTALYALAGVGFMMKEPSKTKSEVLSDFMALLGTEWANQGTPLTARDMRNASLGFKQENWQSKQSIIRALGFDPFDDPPKRNGNSREVHLQKVALPARREKNFSKAVLALGELLMDKPTITMSEASKITGLSRPTVSKYWSEACLAAGVNDLRSGAKGKK